MDLRKITENAGALDERITVQREVFVDDGHGGRTITLSTVCRLYANVKAMSGRERDMANQTESPRNYRFTVRRSALSATIVESDKILWRGKTMNIRVIYDEGVRQRYMVIEAESGVAA